MLAAAVIGGWWITAGRMPPRATVALPATAADSRAEYVGSERCASCHLAEMRAWQGSQHQRAMQPANAQTVLGDFHDASYTNAGVTSRFFQRDGKYFIRTDGPDGRLADFEVEYTFGVAPLQQYLVELSRGHLQALSIAWDTRPSEAGGQRWFHLYPGEKIDYHDELHWTGRQQNWNFMCADCHSTDVRKQYDESTDRYDTTYAEISVGCEACHGPGSAHLAWARSRTPEPARGLTVQLDERHGISWGRDAATGRPVRSAPRESGREIEVCAQCHARRAQIAEGYRAGRPFTDHYLPTLLMPPLYHVDGQQRDEVYVWASWLQSRMHRAGVTCSDCHDPHTQKLRAPGNGVCAQCHDPRRYDAAAHHHHRPASTGAACAECHMPRTTYMVVDGRRDHSMRVPRPDESVTLGVPNACNRCHTDRDARWAATAVRSWLGRDAKGYQSFAATFSAAEAGDPGSTSALASIATATDVPGIVRATAVERIATAGHVAADVEALAPRWGQDADMLVRLAAVHLAERTSPDVLVQVGVRALVDVSRAVRIEAAGALAPLHERLPESDRAAWQAAAQEYLATLTYEADRPESRVARGGFLAATGRPDEAMVAFRSALQLDASYVPAYVNAADVLRAGRHDAEAAAMLQQGLAQVPQSAALYHALGLAQVRLQRTDLAMHALQRAVELDPGSSRYVYVFGVALHSTGRADQGRKVLQRALERWPHDRDLLFALASFQAEDGRLAEARTTARRLLQDYPDDPDARQLAARLEPR